MRHEVTTTVDAPADLVWRTVKDVEKWPEWTPTMIEVDLDGDDLRSGSRATVRQPKQPVRTWTVTELTEGRSFTWTSTGRGLRMSADHVVTEENGRTSVLLTFSVAGPLAPLANLLAGKLVREAIATEAASLKKWCERTSR
ncbi:SRPBCC family protein [Actinophytocola sp. NPDC049390]|uniref:SRPBCC family protein n=1 Tax=Actinophytocola sp. NPDC049390 TaxID=3363894 RepID=UPI00379A3B12